MRALRALGSIRLTIACMALLMVLVVICTLAQVPLGTQLAMERTVRTLLVWWGPEGAGWRVPVFPGGGLVGLMMLANLAAGAWLHLERSRRKAGLWLAHGGLALLFVGEYATALFQVESQMPIEIGQTRDYSEDYRLMELAAADATEREHETVTAIPESLLRRGGEIRHASLPFALLVHRYHENAALAMRKPEDPPSEATQGVGVNLSVRPEPPVTTDDRQNAAAALVEPIVDGRGLGTYWVSNALGAPQGFAHEGRSWRLSLRPRRYYLPFSLTLKEFRHDRYPGTDIPKNFSSLVRLRDPQRGEDRDALIYMNNPLRYGGKTFFQASFGKDDTLSVLMVVRNPGWLIPYLSCVLVALGIGLHFAAKLSASLGAAR